MQGQLIRPCSAGWSDTRPHRRIEKLKLVPPPEEETVVVGPPLASSPRPDAVRPELILEFIKSMTRMPPGHASDVTVRDALCMATRLMISATDRWPGHLNMSMPAPGEFLFSLFGADDREADLWVGARPGHFTIVTAQGDVVDDEKDIPVMRAGEVVAWLSGNGARP